MVPVKTEGTSTAGNLICKRPSTEDPCLKPEDLARPEREVQAHTYRPSVDAFIMQQSFLQGHFLISDLVFGHILFKHKERSMSRGNVCEYSNFLFFFFFFSSTIKKKKEEKKRILIQQLLLALSKLT